ncbi:hypothetical protein [Erythrobacter sp.]|uniref:hypothetical protein n=1 Tax=Erythrobacter sp. TaxID=1042 RepID=UPI001425F536|nr:hypothetical protein [Erythrobacter sp.]QIQ85850.1 MAG: hypothetical protein G9473_03490 [Erythrobacter sp.]
MHLKYVSLVAGACVAVSGCAYKVAETGNLVPGDEVRSYDSWPDDLEGRTFKIEMDQGATNTGNFQPNGTMNILVNDSGPVVKGTYGFASDGDLCIDFVPRGEECWPYQPMREGETMTVTSNRGQTLEVTMLEAM